MPDITARVVLIFQHPKSTEEKPIFVGVTIPWLMEHGRPLTSKGKEWIFHSTEIIQ